MTVPPSSAQADVVVVGGGPAGCAAAIACARAGMRVVLLEREAREAEAEDAGTAAGAAPRPGETLHPGVEPVLRELGAWEAVASAGFLRHEGVGVRWGGDPAVRFQPYGRDPDGTPWRGLQAWRATFDALLRGAAAGAGVAVRRGARATRLLRDAAGGAVGAVRGVETAGGGAVLARWVVVATGRAGGLARTAGLAAAEEHSPRLVARFGYVAGACPARDAAPALLGDPDGRGWSWAARVRPGVYHWARLRFAAGEAGRGLAVPEELKGLRPLGPPSRGAEVTWRRARPAAGARWFLAGDAAAALDPAAGRGVLRALVSGRTAAECVAAVEGGRLAPDDAARRYDAWVGHWFDADVRRLSDLYDRIGGRSR